MQEVYRKSDVDDAIRSVMFRLKLTHKKFGDRILVPHATNGIMVHTRLQTMFNMHFHKHIEHSIYEIIVTHAHKAELLGPGGFDLCIEKLLEKIDLVNDGIMPNISAANLSDIVSNGATVPINTDVEWAINEYISNSDSKTRSILHKAIELAGFTGRIIIEKTTSSPSVELVRGYTFDQSPAWPMNIKFNRPLVACIDGYIETVSELHMLLHEASSTKESIVLFVRGLSDDVKHTLKVNYDRGSLRVIPIVVKFDIEGINAMNDIAIASGADIVSSNKGDVISNTNLSTCVRIDDIIVHTNKVALTNTKSMRAVKTHVEFLRKKRQEEKIDDVAKLFDDRIKTLSPNHVVIRLSDDKDYVATAQAIDYALRAIKSIVDYGTIVINNQKKLTTTAIAAEVHSSRCLTTLLSLGAVVTLGCE